MEELKICKEIIKNVKWYIERKDYKGLKIYIDREENDIKKNIVITRNAEAEYIDNLVKALDDT